jgi:hypothetical protein
MKNRHLEQTRVEEEDARPDQRRQETECAVSRLEHDPSPVAQAEASVTYNMIIEGVLAETAGLALAWLLWSGTYSTRPFVFTLGALTCLFVLWLTVRMGRAGRVEPSPLPARGFSLRLLGGPQPAVLPWAGESNPLSLYPFPG